MGDDHRADEDATLEQQTLGLQNEIKEKLKSARTEHDLKELEPRIRELQALVAKRFALATAPIQNRQLGVGGNEDTSKQ